MIIEARWSIREDVELRKLHFDRIPHVLRGDYDLIMELPSPLQSYEFILRLHSTCPLHLTHERESRASSDFLRLLVMRFLRDTCAP